jgi:polysaccharide biosynthesis transport protein
VLRERWRWVAAGVVAGIVMAVLVTVVTAPTYSSASTILITATADSDPAAAYQNGMLAEQKARSYAGLVYGDDVRAALRAQVGETAPGRITATAGTGTALITITAADGSAVRAQRMATVASEAFVQAVAQIERPADPVNRPVLEARIVADAALPPGPVSPDPLANLLLGLLGGLVVGALAGIVRSTTDDRVRSAADLTDVGAAPLLGRVPADERITLAPLVVLEHPDSDQAESFREIRNALRLAAPDLRVLTVTSACSGDGKTATAANLAIALAQTGAQVALVAADLRSRRMADLFGLDDCVGLTDVVVGGVAVERAMRTWCRGNLHVLAGGAGPAYAGDVVAAEGTARLLADLRDRYTYVVIDTPSAAGSGDAALLTALADGAILVVRQGVTRRGQVADAAAALAPGGRVVGTVLSRTPLTRAQRRRIAAEPVAAASDTDEPELWLRERTEPSGDERLGIVVAAELLEPPEQPVEQTPAPGDADEPDAVAEPAEVVETADEPAAEVGTPAYRG